MNVNISPFEVWGFDIPVTATSAVHAVSPLLPSLPDEAPEVSLCVPSVTGNTSGAVCVFDVKGGSL